MRILMISRRMLRCVWRPTNDMKMHDIMVGVIWPAEVVHYRMTILTFYKRSISQQALHVDHWTLGSALMTHAAGHDIPLPRTGYTES